MSGKLPSDATFTGNNLLKIHINHFLQLLHSLNQLLCYCYALNII